ncbi:hypothetical protein KVT40_000068 [Elsinoe batatas]|uniref:rRNA-processing protein EFG1 n=1 Tax=Elsinoe batatas TaxID=2601811 RepID=A0A8K0PKS9_9PEZI|nr:hypothetical protein KVT40_000068 [Elsinoe batatas]
MGTKRPNTDSHIPHSSKKHKPNTSHPTSKPSHPRGAGSHKPKKPNPVAPLKSRIRSLRRLLSHDDALDSPRLQPRSLPALDDNGLHPSRSAILHSKDELDIAAKHQRREEGKQKRLPANVRVERERELRGLEEKVVEEERRRKRGEMVGRWHMVRFFERRRGERRLRRARRGVKELEEGMGGGGEGDEGGKSRGKGGKEGDKERERKLEEARERVRRAEVDLNYALYWPLERAYVSLWPRKGKEGKEGKDGGDEEDGEEEAKGDREMWALVERCMAEGALEDLREGRVEGCGVERPEVNASKGIARKDKGKKEKAVETKQDEEAEESDDGGFFE